MRIAVLRMGFAGVAVAMMVLAASAKGAKVEPSTHNGTFVSAASGKMVMTGHNGKEHTHALAKDVKVTIDGKSGKLADLKKGMRISVTTDKAGTVTTITTSPVKPASAVKPAAPARPVTPPTAQRAATK